MAGYYTALMTIAGVTYQAIVSAAFIIFPIISQASFEQQTEAMKGYIRQTTRYTLMLMALSATVFSANAPVVLEILYRKEYAVGAPALAIAAYGLLFFGLIYILTTIISSSGKPRVSLLVGGATLIASVLLNIFLIPKYGLVGAAGATTIAMFIGVILASSYIYHSFKACFDIKSTISVVVAAASMYLVASVLPANIINVATGKLSVLINFAFQAGIQTTVYLGVLIVAREIGLKEVNLIRKVIKI